MPEAWWISTTPARFGWLAVGESNRGQRFAAGEGAAPFWRPTEQWARRAVAKRVRAYAKRQRDQAEREARGHIYPIGS